MGGFNKSDSESSSQSTNRSFVFPEQVGPLTNLYGQASNVANSQSGIGNAARTAATPLIGAGNDFLSSLTNLGGSDNSGFASSLANGQFDPNDSEFFQNLAMMANPISDPFLQSQIDLLGEDITTQVGRLMPGVDSEFIGSGTAGGARNQIERGLTNEAGINAFAQGAGALRNESLNRSLQANNIGLGGQLSAEQINNQSLVDAASVNNQTGATTVAAASTGLNSLNDLLGLNLSPYSAQFSPLMALSQILGNPAILSEGQSTGQSQSSGFGFNAAALGGG